ncbi:Phosphatidylserine decarboxylase-related protein [Syntrophomonas zehnderi OL-4]|uniref:Phosphatidylserine decarboxylase proenzyme n=1 Tax=Syntrophomonas zehnderi OL-4 TaxID=690567 RepID=A0A0E3W330_9FIRM|nr:phosphatidylserine decarboxylase family protein [Syntrophomonas zehnderi]CFX44501.1 Phosphatidylserine decarboxylase-related protein [Syntrophomonas zehnderi OL-4]
MKHHNEIIAREGWVFVFLFLLVTGIMYYFRAFSGAWLTFILALFCAFFFRNPKRSIPDSIGTVVSPADGRIMDIEKVYEDQYLNQSALRVRIFLSLLNVHINRVPINGEVEWVQRVAGQFLPAYKSEAGTKNARNYIGVATPWGRVLVVQVTGLVARRLVCWVKPGDDLQTGERFGLIRFGSCTELYLPPETTVLVQAGERVKGGETILAKLSE